MVTINQQILKLAGICQISEEEKKRIAEKFPSLNGQQKMALRENLLQQLFLDSAKEVVEKAEKEGVGNDESKLPCLYREMVDLAIAKEKQSLTE